MLATTVLSSGSLSHLAAALESLAILVGVGPGANLDWIARTLAAASPAGLLLAILVYERISVYEEEFLRGKFGAAHTAWATSVPALLPRLSGWVKPKYPFWWKRMIWREQNKLFLLVTTVFLTWFARLGFDPAALDAGQWRWVYAFGALVVIRFVIGGLKMIGFFKELS